MNSLIDQPWAILVGRLSVLERMQADLLSEPNVTIEDVRVYVADLTEYLLPLDYHVYRRRWQALPDGAALGPLLSFPEWYPLVEELDEIGRLAEMLEEAPSGAQWDALRRVLLVTDESAPAEPPDGDS